MLWTKSINIFTNGGDQIFNQIFLRDEIFRKSRQIWTEKLNRVYDGITKGSEKFKYGIENLTIPYPSESGTFTNTWNRNQKKISSQNRSPNQVRYPIVVPSQY